MLLVISLFCACSDDDNGPAATNIDQSTLTLTPSAGAVTIKWTVPSGANYKYVKVTYRVPDESTDRLRLASVYSDSIYIDNLYEKYGDIQFNLQPVTEQGAEGNVVSITGTAGHAATTVKETKYTQIPLTIDQVWTDDQEEWEGPLENLINGNTSDFFHMSWSNPSPFPHYIVVDLGTTHTALQFTYVCRNQANRDNPKEMDILGSTSFDGTNYDEAGTTLIASLSGLPSDQGASYSSATLKSDTPFRYVWFKIKSSVSGSNWVALSELSVFQVAETIYDPEIGDETVVEY